MKIIALFLPCVSAAITVTSVAPTPQQVVIRFNTGVDAPTSCTLDLTDGFTSAEAYATNSTLFPGSNQISTSNSIITGHSVQYTGGLREVQTGSDGNRYSMSLGEDTDYTHHIVCPSASLTGTFHTKPIPVGMTHQDAPYPCPDNTGKVCSQTVLADINGTTAEVGRQWSTIDYQTGARIHALTMPSDNVWSEEFERPNLSYDVTGSSWTIPSGWNAGSATASTSSTDIIFAGEFFGDAFQACTDAFCQTPYIAPMMFDFAIHAYTDNPACTGGTNAIPACQFTVVETTNGISPSATAQSYTFTLDTSSAGGGNNFQLGTRSAYDTGQQTGKPVLSYEDVRVQAGTLNCNGTNTCTKVWNGLGSLNPEHVVSGSYLCIGDTSGPLGNGCHKVASLTNALTVVFTDTIASGSYALSGSSFGVLIQRATSDSFHLFVTGPITGSVAGKGWNPWNQAQYRGSSQNVTLPNGDPAQLILGNESFYSVDRITGEAHPYMGNQSNSNLSWNIPGIIGFPGDNAGNYYGLSGTALQAQTYWGNFQAPTNVQYCCGASSFGLWNWEGFANLPTCTGTAPNYTNEPCVTVNTVISNVSTLTQAFDATFNPTYFNAWQLTSIENGDIILNVSFNNGGISSSGSQFWDWAVVVDPAMVSSAAGCVGGGLPGCVIAARQVWSAPGSRWTPDKGTGFNGRPGWTTNQATAFTYPPIGPNTAMGPAIQTTTSTITTVSCPGGSGFSTCIQFSVAGQPYDINVSPTLAGVWGNYMVGDLIWVGGTLIPWPYSGAYPTPFPAVTIVGISGTTLTCGVGFDSPASTASGQTIYMMSNFPGNLHPWSNGIVNIGNGMFWDFADDPHGTNSTGNTVITNLSIAGAHSFSAFSLYGAGQLNSSLQPACQVFNENCYGFQNFRSFTNSALAAAFKNTSGNTQTGSAPLFSAFAGATAFMGGLGDNSIQTHPNVGCASTTDPACLRANDGRPWMGAHGISTVPNAGGVPTPVSGYTTVYKVTPSGTLHPKLFDTLISTGYFSYQNISGPASSIVDGPSGYYTFCHALKATECVSTSSIGDYYVNWPRPVLGLDGSGDPCYFGGGEATAISDNWFVGSLCGPMDNIAENNENVNLGMGQFDNVGNLTATYLGRGLNGAAIDIFSGIYSGNSSLNPVIGPDWVYYNAQCVDKNCRFFNMLVRLPRNNIDAINRSDFVPVKVSIPSLPPGASTVAVRFGYAEYNGGKCSPNYNASCYAVTSAVNDTTPFYWKGETFSGLSCASGCSINIPGLSGHVVTAYVVGLDGSNNEVYVGPPIVANVP